MSHEMPFKKLIWKFLLVTRWLASHENFTGISLVFRWYFPSKPYSRNSRETVAKLSVQNWKTWELDHLTPSWTYTWNRSQKHSENMFFTQKKFEKLWKTWAIQITSKSKQKEQKSFWFEPQMVEHTHIIFEHVQSYKWNRYLLNIRFVCYVCVSNVE